MHTGGKVDLYVRTHNPLVRAAVTIESAASLVPLNTATGFQAPIGVIEAVYSLGPAGRPQGAALVAGQDYAITVTTPHYRFSPYEQLSLSVAPAYQGGRPAGVLLVLRPLARRAGPGRDARAAARAGRTRSSALFLPAMVSFTLEAEGHAITDEAMRQAMVAYLKQAGGLTWRWRT